MSSGKVVSSDLMPRRDIVVVGLEDSGSGVTSLAIARALVIDVIKVDRPSDILSAKRTRQTPSRVFAAGDDSAACLLIDDIIEIAARKKDAVFVLCERDALGFVAAKLRRMPRLSFVEHPLLWMRATKATTLAALALKDRLVLVPHHLLVNSPEEAAERLVRSAVLPESTSAHFIDAIRNADDALCLDPKAGSLPIERLGWSLEEKAAFLSICSDVFGDVRRQAFVRTSPLVVNDLLVEREGLLIETEHLDSGRDGVRRFFTLHPETDSPRGIVLPSVNLLGRNHLRARFINSSDMGSAVQVKLEVCESFTGRPLLVHEAVLEAREELDLSATVSASSQPVSIVLWTELAHSDFASASLDVQDFVFSS